MPEVKPASAATTGLTPAAKRKGVARTLTQDRAMKCYILTDFEMDGLSSMNGACTFSLGMATAFLGIAAGIRTSASFADPNNIPPAAKLLAGPGFWLAVAMGVVFATAAVISYFRARGAVNRIKEESGKGET